MLVFVLLVPSKSAAFSKKVYLKYMGMVGCGERVVYLTSPGSPADIGLHLGKACYPCSR